MNFLKFLEFLFFYRDLRALDRVGPRDTAEHAAGAARHSAGGLEYIFL